MIRKILVIKMTTGERIKMLRKEHNLTQEELGAKIGVQKAAIQKYEKGTEFKKAHANLKLLRYIRIRWKSNPYANVKQGRSTKT